MLHPRAFTLFFCRLLHWARREYFVSVTFLLPLLEKLIKVHYFSTVIKTNEIMKHLRKRVYQGYRNSNLPPCLSRDSTELQ